jgi:glycosyltransferase involved in cell wall biosynthesis
MKILLCHNHYQQPGGEDASFAAEARLLERHGHTVLRYTVHNDALKGVSRLTAAARTFWNRQSYREVRTLLRAERPEIMHCTNTFPLLSPAAYYAARAEGVPVVQSLRNYRLLCPGANFLRDGRVCEDCLGKRFAWPALRHACYHQGRAATAVVAGMTAAHRLLGTWSRAVDRYFATTQFARERFITAGFPAERIAVKPNFLDDDPGPGDGAGGFAVFVGRLSAEKGVDTLLAAWDKLPEPPVLKIIGDGPLAGLVQDAAARNRRIQWLGRRPAAETLDLVGEAMLLVMPSVCYETFGRTIIEAYAKATPVVASRLGAMSELVDDGRTGLFFEAGNADDLAAKVARLAGDSALLSAMRGAAREQFLRHYTAEPNYRMMMAIYADAAAHRGAARKHAISARPAAASVPGDPIL